MGGGEIAVTRGGRFHIKALSLISALKNRSRRCQIFLLGMRGHGWNVEEGPIFFRLVAMASPKLMGRNGSMFSANLCQHLMGGMGSVGCHFQCEQSLNMAQCSAERNGIGHILTPILFAATITKSEKLLNVAD